MNSNATSMMPARAAIFLMSAVCLVTFGGSRGQVRPADAAQAAYIGSQACRECHPEIYDSYQANSQKAHSFRSVKIMMPKLTPAEIQECFACHTTGYGQPGGFVSEEQTPDMANAGCEVCHGPGNRHAESQSAEDIKGKLSVADCAACHNEERVGTFKYKPMIFGGGH